MHDGVELWVRGRRQGRSDIRRARHAHAHVRRDEQGTARPHQGASAQREEGAGEARGPALGRPSPLRLRARRLGSAPEAGAGRARSVPPPPGDRPDRGTPRGAHLRRGVSAANRGPQPPGRRQATGRNAYCLSSLVRCGICGHRMSGAWNHGEPYYRCRFPSEYAGATGQHPSTVYLRESDITPGLDTWLPGVFDPKNLDAAVAALSAAQAPRRSRPRRVSRLPRCASEGRMTRNPTRGSSLGISHDGPRGCDPCNTAPSNSIRILIARQSIEPVAYD
jgi:Recombinase zinc beta ribbon domain